MSTRQLPAADPDSDGGNDAVPGQPQRLGARPGGCVRTSKRVQGARSSSACWSLAILAGAGWALLGSSLLVVRHVEVTGNRLVTAAQVRQAARIEAGAPLATVSTATAARRVEQLAPVLSATVRRSWPDAIVITVRERTPVFAVAAAGGYQLIDSHGVTVRQATRKPASTAAAVLSAGRCCEAARLSRPQPSVLRQLPRALRKRVASVSAASAGSVTLHLTGGITVLWGGAGRSGTEAGRARNAAAQARALLRHQRPEHGSDGRLMQARQSATSPYRLRRRATRRAGRATSG